MGAQPSSSREYETIHQDTEHIDKEARRDQTRASLDAFRALHHRGLPFAESVVTDLIQAVRVDVDSHRDPQHEVPIIQFGSPTFYAQEGEHVTPVSVLRLGNTSYSSTVHFETIEHSAKAGVKYVPTRGVLEFGPGEWSKCVLVNILDDDNFDAALDFGVQLSAPSRARLANEPCRCRVVIIDDDAFPTNRFRDELQSGRVDDIPALSLMWEYWVMCFRDRHVRMLALLYVVLDLLKTLYFFVTLYLQMYLVDHVLGNHHAAAQDGRRLMLTAILAAGRRLGGSVGSGGGEDALEQAQGTDKVDCGSRKAISVVVGLMYILPFLGLHIADTAKLNLGIAGSARMKLQANLLRKFFHFSEQARHSIAGTEVTMAIVREVTEVVELGLMKLIQCVRIIGKFTLALVFLLQEETKAAAIPVLVIPLVMGWFLYMVSAVNVDKNEEKDDAENRIVSELHSTVTNMRLVADYGLTTMILRIYQSCLEKFNRSSISSGLVSTQIQYFPQWLVVLLVGVYLMTGTFQVTTCGGTVSLGAFLATVNIYKEIGADLKAAFHEASEIVLATGPLRQVVSLMNQLTDVELHMETARWRKQFCTIRMGFQDDNRSPDSKVLPLDLLDIEMHDLSFRYRDGLPLVLSSVNVKIKQGTLVAVLGPPHMGKSTLLRILGGVLLPPVEDGRTMVPPHLHLLHVSPEAYVVERSTFLSNIVFNAPPQAYGGVRRVQRICSALGFSSSIVKLLDGAGDEELNDTHLLSVLSQSDTARLNLARAFIANPEVMVIHKPLLHFAEHEKQKILGLFRTHIEDRGLECRDPIEWRRPRTVVFTASSFHGLEIVDSFLDVREQKVTTHCGEDIFPSINSASLRHATAYGIP